MQQCRLIPVQRWPETPNPDPRNGQFKVDYPTLTTDLSDELYKLDAQDIVIQMYLDDAKARTYRRSYDGWPKADTKPSKPGVILSFESDGKLRTFACDTYWDWQDNLRGISLTLTALRAVSRYGCSRKGQQIAATRPCRPPPVSIPIQLSDQVMARYLVFLRPNGNETEVYSVLHDSDFYKSVRRSVEQMHHPDKGGDHETYVKIREAVTVLNKRHGL